VIATGAKIIIVSARILLMSIVSTESVINVYCVNYEC
jgi:hypothetical protein